MDNRYKVKKILRIITAFSASIISFGLLVDVCKLTSFEIEGFLFSEVTFRIVCCLVLVSCAMNLIMLEYRINHDALIIKDFIRREKKYPFSQISKLEEVQAWPFKYIRILHNGNKLRNIVPLDNQDQFVKLIQEKINESSSSTS